MKNFDADCTRCGTQTYGLREYKELLGVRPCKVTDIKGVEHDSLEPYFSEPEFLCCACYNEAAQNDARKINNE